MIENNDAQDEDDASSISSVSAYSDASDDPFSLTSIARQIGGMLWISPIFSDLNIDEDTRDDIQESIFQQPFNPISLEIVAHLASLPKNDNKKRQQQQQQQKQCRAHDQHKPEQQSSISYHVVHPHSHPTIAMGSSLSTRLLKSRRTSKNSKHDSKIPVVQPNGNASHHLLKLPALKTSSKSQQKEQTLRKTKSKFSCKILKRLFFYIYF
jgi:hypothetical protein